MQKKELLNKLGARRKMFEDYKKQVRRQSTATHKRPGSAKLSGKA